LAAVSHGPQPCALLHHSRTPSGLFAPWNSPASAPIVPYMQRRTITRTSSPGFLSWRCAMRHKSRNSRSVNHALTASVCLLSSGIAVASFKMGGVASRATMWVSQVNTTGRQPHAITAVFHQHPLLPGRSGVPATRACHSSIVSVDCSCTAIVGGGGQHSAWRHTKLPLVCGDAPVLGSRFKASRVNHLARCERRLGICAALLRARLTHIDKPPCPVMRLRGMYTRFISGGLLCGGGIPHRGTMRIPQLAPGREHHERRHSGATRGRFDQHAHTAPTPSFGGHCAAGRVSRQATCSRACSTSSGIDRAAKAAAVEASSPPYCAALAAQYASATWWPNFTGSEIFGAWARAHSWAAISNGSDICHRLLSTPQHIPAHVGAQVFAAHQACGGGFDSGAVFSRNATFTIAPKQNGLSWHVDSLGKPVGIANRINGYLNGGHAAILHM